MSDYYHVNTNRDHFPDGQDGTAIYDEGIVAAFGSHGSKLEPLNVGDTVFSYVDEVGYRAVGEVLEPFDGEPVNTHDDMIGPADSDEYHVEVDWLTVLPEDRAINYTQYNKMVGYPDNKPPQGTLYKIRDRGQLARRFEQYLRGRADPEPSMFIAAEGSSDTNIGHTVATPVDATTIRDHSDLSVEGNEGYLWGTKSERPDVEEGDWFLFSAKAEFPYAARVIDDDSAPELGDAVWEPFGDNEFIHVFLLEEPRKSELTRRQFQQIVDYNLNWSGQQFAKPNGDAMALLRRKFGGVEKFINTITQTEVPDRYERIADQLEETKQVIFYGPPGTGKTHHANQFAEWWVNEHPETRQTNTQVQFVTFHPSFTYEDFIEGLTARSGKDGITYEMDDGMFKEFANSIRTWDESEHWNPEDFDEAPRYIFVIDEINRGNVAQIFGEMITLLESDKRAGASGALTVNLSHSDTEFELPSNVYLIGTMNTADRSIALVDAALRRRFGFVHFPPDYAHLREHYDFAGPGEVEAAHPRDDTVGLQALSISALQVINEAIRTRNDLGRGKQVGHSYLRERTSEQELVKAWKLQILPLLEEYFFASFDDLRSTVFNEIDEASYLIDWREQRIRDTFTDPQHTATDEPTALRQALRSLVDTS